MSENLPVSQNNALAQPNSAAMAILKQANDQLAYAYDQMLAMSEATLPSGSSNYDFSGKVKIEVNRNGTLVFNNPFTGKIDGGPTLTIVPISVKFQLQRWLGEKEEIDGVDKEKQRGPLCRSCQFEEPVPTRNEQGEMVNEINETGWFFQPALSAYHAQSMLPTLTGSNGPDGKSGLTLCSQCPMAVQGFKGNEFGGRCAPIGMLECVIFKVNDEMLPEPVYGYVKMSVTSIIDYVDFLKQIQKRYKDPVTERPLLSPAMRMILVISCESASSGARSWGRLSFQPFAGVNPSTEQGVEILNNMARAIDNTTARLNELADKDKSRRAVSEKPSSFSKPSAPF